MQTKWDYTDLAQSYLKRPAYSQQVIDEIINTSQLGSNDMICDIGAGVGHLTIKLASLGNEIIAIEPNDSMRILGEQQCNGYKNINWIEATAEDTKQKNDNFSLVSFGSSFNVTDRLLTLSECQRIIKPMGWFAALWNHRNLDDPLQKEIENIIKFHIPNYQYGTRREDQSEFLETSGFFKKVIPLTGKIKHSQKKIDVVEAWKSHATLHRQAGNKFATIINEIEKLLSAHQDIIVIPYTTNAWLAQFNS